jgi:aspartate ammonia-lyase
LGEIKLPPRQAGSSIMPGKVNPVIPEAASQVAMLAFGYDQVIAQACAAGSLELNPFLPLVAACLLDEMELLANADGVLQKYCIAGLEADVARCREHVEDSTAIVTALLPALGYEAATRVAGLAKAQNKSIREIVLGEGLLSAAQFDESITAEAVCRLGLPQADFVRLPRAEH